MSLAAEFLSCAYGLSVPPSRVCLSCRGLVFVVEMGGTMSSITFSVKLDMCLQVAVSGAVPDTCSADLGLTMVGDQAIPVDLFSISESFCTACSSTTGECANEGSSGSDDDDVCFSADSTVQVRCLNLIVCHISY